MKNLTTTESVIGESVKHRMYEAGYQDALLGEPFQSNDVDYREGYVQCVCDKINQGGLK